ncbi:hypothetical protein N5D83_02805 [Pseudomonas chengduensis]|nr:LPD38 domain-containing protein [Pseudomonas chengduensis]MDH1865748.1 hypothetical protein [Pseudomonas chengduensis]
MALKPYDGDFEPLDAGSLPASNNLKPYDGDFEPLSSESAPQASGLIDTITEGVKSTGRAIGSTIDTYTGDGQGVVDKAKAQQEAPKDQRLQSFYTDIQDRKQAHEDETGEAPGLFTSVKNVGGAILDNPAGAGLALAEQLPNAAPTLAGGWAGMKAGAAGGAALGTVVPGVGNAAGGVVGGIAGGLAGMFLGNTLTETGHKAMEAAGDGEFTPEEMSQVKREGAIKGGVITAVDAATLGVGRVASRFLTKATGDAIESATRRTLIDQGIDVADEAAVLAAKQNPGIAAAVQVAQREAIKATDTLKRRAAEAGTLMGMETVGEGLGEYLGELAATGQADTMDAVLEAFMGAGQSAVEAGWNMSQARKDTTLQPMPTPENPAPAPIARPDPNAGPLSAAANLLPAPEQPLGLPAPDPVFYGDTTGGVSPDGPNINVDGAMQRAAQAGGWVNPDNNPAASGGPGMSQPTPRGEAAPLVGTLIQGERNTPGQSDRLRQGEVIDGQVIDGGRALPAPAARISDQREQGFAVDAQGNVSQARMGNAPPANYVQGGRGMDQQAPVGRRYSNILQAKKAIRESGDPQALEAVKTGPRQFEVRAKDQPSAVAPRIEGSDLGDGWAEFTRESGSIGVPRAEMPQIKAEHRGAMVNFLNARGVQHQEEILPAVSLKPTQAEFSRDKVAKAKGHEGGNRSILISQDGHVLDGHHQWLAARDKGEDVKVIRLNAPMADLLPLAREFPSSFTDQASQEVQGADSRPGPVDDRTPGDTPAATQVADGQRALSQARDPRRVVNRDRDSVMHAVIRLGGITTQWRQDTTGDAKGNKFLPGVGALWTDKTGTSLDDMASLLDQSGYVPAGEMARDGGVTWLQQALRDEIAGQQTRYAPGSARQEADLIKREAERFGFTDDADWQEIEAKLDAAFDLTEDIAELEARKAAHEARVAELDSLLGDTNESSAEETGNVPAGGQTAVEPGRQEVRPAEGSQQPGSRDSEQGSGAEAPGNDFALEQQTEQSLNELAAAQQAADQAEAEAQRQVEQRAQADNERADFTLTGSDRPSDATAARGQNDMFAPRTRGEAKQKIEDLGEKIGGARKDTSAPGVKRERTGSGDDRPSWARRFEISQIVKSSNVDEIGRWQIRDARSKDWMNQPRQIGGSFATQEEAELAVPVIAVAQKHRVVPLRQGEGTGFEIWRSVNDRKRVKVVDQIFPSREEAMAYMAVNARQIIETNTTFGEADLPRPENIKRIGEVRRDGPVKDRDFIDTFGFRGVEFGNWNNQEDRQQLLDDAYDGLLDLAEIMDIPPKAISLDGELGLAFGARGQGLSGARAHYEPSKVVINLTKMNGAGSLAHEWFHALDHYLGRQDGKATAKWQVDDDGTRSLKVTGSFEREAASSGFSRYGSGVREEVRQAYKQLMQTMTAKAEQYVEDTARADDFVGRARKEVADRLDRLRTDLVEQKDPTYWKRNNKPASAEQLADFDTVAQQILEGVQLDTELRATNPDAKVKRGRILSGMRWTNDALEKISAVYKAVRGRTGFNAEGNGELDRLRGTMGMYSSRLKMLAEAQSGAEKTKQVPTNFAMDARELDQGRGTDYWTTPHEMAARAFQGYVEDRIADRGGVSPFMNFGPESAVIPTPWGWKRPFPAGEERIAINASFDNLVGILQTRETETGGVAIYSRASYRRAPEQGQGARSGQLRMQIKRLTGAWQNAPDVKVVQSIKDLPDRQRRQVERDGAFDVEGIFADGQVYLVADNLRDAQHAAFVLQHEVLGHAGLQGAYGQRLTPLLMSIYNGNPEMKAQADALVRRFGYKPAVAMEEVLADMAGAGTIQQQAFWPRLVTAMRNALRSIGFNMRWTDGDIQGLLANARRYIERGKGRGRGRTVFSRNGDSGRLVEMVDEQGRLLAPNGKPSKLTQKQWHQARSDNFKRWFGDWQALDAQSRLDDKAPLKLRMPDTWKALTERERLDKVEASLKTMARQSEALPHDDLGDVTMAMSGAKKAASSAADPAKQAVLTRLQQAFEHSIYASSTLSTQSGQTAAYHKLLAPIDVDGVPLVAVFTVREDVNGRMFYNTVTVDRKENALAVSPGDMSSDAQGSLPANTKASGTFVRRPLARVNPEDVSKVTDGNGEPLVLHHGTGEQFNVFDQGRAGLSTGHTTAPLGIFLTGDAELAQAYAVKASDGMPGLANVMPLFASIKTPYRMSIAESQALDTPEKAIAFRQQLEREGYDGVQLVGTPTWVAFYNNQVKSATNNTGAFDEIDPDIRYSRASQRDTEALRKLGLAGSDAQNLLDQVRNVTLGGLQTKLKDWSVRSEEGIFDGLAGIRRAEEAVGVTDANQQGYVSARLASGIADVMHGVLHYAAPEWRDGIVSGKAGTRGVLDILGDLGADNLTPWLAWLGGKRAQLLKAQGRENNLTDTEIAELVAMGQGKEELFEKVYREYAQVNEAVLDLAQEAGLIDQDARAKWLTDYYVPFYRQDESEGIFTAPRSKRGLSHQTAAIKALKGGNLPTNDLLSNMLAGWTKRIDASMKNKALLEVVDNLQGSDFLTDESPRWQQVLISRDQIAQQIRKDRKALALAADLLDLPAGSNVIKVVNQLMKPESEGFEKLWTRVAPTDPDIVRVQRDGKSEYYRVNDESLLRGLKFMEGSVFNDPITKIGRTFKRILTTGVTASPDFILRNFIRDAAHAWVINKDGFTLGKDSLKGMRDALREDQDYRDLMFAGGSFQGGYVHGADPEASAQIIRRALEKKGFTRTQQEAYLGSLVNTPAKAAAMLGKGWQKYRELGDKVENANRLSTYKAAIEAGKSRRQASYEAKDLMDYSLRGNFAAAQWFTDVVPFLNARLQGLYKLGRAVKGDKTLLAKEVAMKGGYIALFSLMLAGLNDDDERYQALMDWDKDMHWHIFLGDEHFRIPKPFELGLIFGTVPERILHALTGTQDGGDLAKAVSQGVFQTLAFNPVPQFYQPIRELQANRNFFRDSPIEDMSDEGKLPEARYDERTSAIGRALGQVTGPIAGLSPKQVDHLIAAYTGTLGQYVLDMSSLVANTFSDAERPASRSGDIPILKVLYQGDSPRSTKYQAEFYDMMREADQLNRTIKAYREEGRVDAAEQLMAANREKLRHRPALGLARKQLGNVRNQMDAVYRDTSMTPEQKRQRLDALQRQSNQIAERIVKLAGGDF